LLIDNGQLVHTYGEKLTSHMLGLKILFEPNLFEPLDIYESIENENSEFLPIIEEILQLCRVQKYLKEENIFKLIEAFHSEMNFKDVQISKPKCKSRRQTD
jgi:hypothetical protein